MTKSGGGGAGGGAILIASNNSLTVTGTIAANGGGSFHGGCNSCPASGGSGGGIRIIADEVTINGALRALQAGTGDCFVRKGGLGRIRVEGNTVSATDPGDPLFVQDLPTFTFPPGVFPPGMSPKLRATIVDDGTIPPPEVPADPRAIITDNTMVDVNIATSDLVTVAGEPSDAVTSTVTVGSVSKSNDSPATSRNSLPITSNLGSLTVNV